MIIQPEIHPDLTYSTYTTWSPFQYPIYIMVDNQYTFMAQEGSVQLDDYVLCPAPEGKTEWIGRVSKLGSNKKYFAIQLKHIIRKATVHPVPQTNNSFLDKKLDEINKEIALIAELGHDIFDPMVTRNVRRFQYWRMSDSDIALIYRQVSNMFFRYFAVTLEDLEASYQTKIHSEDL